MSEFKVGDRVRLTPGGKWDNEYTPGGDPFVETVVTVTEVDEEGNAIFNYGGYKWAVIEGFPAELVEPAPTEHPNFIQVYLEDEDGYVESYQASRTVYSYGPSDKYPTNPWTLPEIEVYSLDAVTGLRLLLDEIERRMVAEAKDADE